MFDPWRSAILLVAGDKAQQWNRWYERAIPHAEHLYETYFEGAGGGGWAMSSYTNWDRAAYIDRVGGEEEAERRLKALMARQSGYRLAEERKRRGLTQAQLADVMGVSPGRVSQIERGEVSTLDSIVRYVEALGGRLDVVANFDDHTLTVTTTDAA